MHSLRLIVWLCCCNTRGHLPRSFSSPCPHPCVSRFSSSSWTWTCTSSSSMCTLSGHYPTGTPPNEESGPLANNTPLTGYEPNNLDDFHNSETTEIICQEQSGDKDAVSSYLHDPELDDETIGKAPSSPLFTQEREDPASRRQAYHSLDESLLPSESLSFCHVRTERPVHELCSYFQASEKTKSRLRKWANQDSPWTSKKQILDDCWAKIQKHEFLADSDRRSIQEPNGIIESQRREIDHAHTRDEQVRRDQLLLHEQLAEQNRDLRESHMKSLNEMEELKRFQRSRFEEDWPKIKTLSLNSRPEFRNCRMEF